MPNTTHMTKNEYFDYVQARVFKAYLVIILIHFIGISGLAIAGNLQAFFYPTPNHGVIIWVICNDALGIFACIFATACFSGRNLLLKIIGYPFGVLIMVMVMCTLSFPIGILGIVLGMLAPAFF